MTRTFAGECAITQQHQMCFSPGVLHPREPRHHLCTQLPNRVRAQSFHIQPDPVLGVALRLPTLLESAPFSPALCHYYLGLGFPCLPGERPLTWTAYLVLSPLALILILSSPDKRIFLNYKHNHVPPLLQIPRWLPNTFRLQSNLSACVFTGLSGKISPFMGT